MQQLLGPPTQQHLAYPLSPLPSPAGSSALGRDARPGTAGFGGDARPGSAGFGRVRRALPAEPAFAAHGGGERGRGLSVRGRARGRTAPRTSERALAAAPARPSPSPVASLPAGPSAHPPAALPHAEQLAVGQAVAANWPGDEDPSVWHAAKVVGLFLVADTSVLRYMVRYDQFPNDAMVDLERGQLRPR
ncbi:hypothetical protein T492DRAFT_906579 [Pavlovales sp. CCMP2436]|nr:hypothetical protein T492DRAFT_906579 [Pavlovales sp. CCMP2436]